MMISEANGRDRLNGRSIKDVHANLKTALGKLGLNDSLDYFEVALAKRKTENVPFPAFEWLSCSPVTGEAGGHYIYIGTVSKNRHNLVFVGKTSQGFQVACEIANTCAEHLGA